MAVCLALGSVLPSLLVARHVFIEESRGDPHPAIRLEDWGAR